MIAYTLHERKDRKTGKLIAKTIIDHHEISESEYAERLVIAITGMAPEDAARHIRMESFNSESLEVLNVL